jgi:hypothetical protein
MLRKRANHVLQSPSTYVSLANFDNRGDADVPLGWLVAAPNIIHFANVRAPYRQMGMAALLIETLAEHFKTGLSECPFPSEGWVPCTHWTVKLPLTGWTKRKDLLLFYCGFEPLGYD